MESANLYTSLKEEFSEMTLDLEEKSTYTFKGMGYLCVYLNSSGAASNSKSIFKRSFTSLNSKFSFSYTGCHT